MISDDTRLTVKKIFTEYLEKKGHGKHLRGMQFLMRFIHDRDISILNRFIFS